MIIAKVTTVTVIVVIVMVDTTKMMKMVMVKVIYMWVAATTIMGVGDSGDTTTEV